MVEAESSDEDVLTQEAAIANDSDSESDESESFYSADSEDDSEADSEDEDPRVKVLSVLELEDLFLKKAPPLSSRLFLARSTKAVLTSSSLFRCQWEPPYKTDCGACGLS